MWKIDHVCSTQSMIIVDCSIATVWVLLEETGIVIEVFGKSHNLVDSLDFGYKAFHSGGQVDVASEFVGASCLNNGRQVMDFDGSQIRLCRFEEIVVVNVLNEHRESIKSLTVRLDDLIPAVA